MRRPVRRSDGERDPDEGFVRQMRRALFDAGHPTRSRRFTQDSPILPDVWLAYAASPSEPQDLLVNPTRGERTGRIAHEMRGLVEALRKSRPVAQAGADAEAGPAQRARRSWGDKEARVVHMPGMIAARLYFNELMRIVLPSTQWWEDQMRALGAGPLARGRRAVRGRGGEAHHLFDPGQIAILIACYDAMLAGGSAPDEAQGAAPPYEFLKLIELAAMIVERHDAAERAAAGAGAGGPAPHPVTLFASIYEDWPADPAAPRSSGVIWSVTRNRRAEPAIRDSVKAMKADAGRRLFAISCRHLRCAVVDSGIDAAHPAFADREGGGSRVIETYDFAELRHVLDPRFLRRLKEAVAAGGPAGIGAASPREGRALGRVHARFLRAMSGERDEGEAAFRKRTARYLDLVIERAEAGLEIDWAMLEPLIRDPDPPRPRLPHGTQVAGILAGDLSDEEGAPAGPAAPAALSPPDAADRRRRHEARAPLVGVCPDLRLYDLRVVSETDDGGETLAAHDFEVIAALKFIGHLNGRADEPAIHAANVSLSLEHDVSRFACGRTPICEECERLVSSGVAVVAATGNSGYAETEEIDARFYRSGSITDPGNAETVITVGSTHRQKPHQYGVSYFSSRGPTGDGRRKPDIVAPGEKLSVPSPGGRVDIVDGTSFAAPHVTGAALMLMARHSELVGRPQRIKEVLCASATDLGREPYSQGAGMLDVLRALQSV